MTRGVPKLLLVIFGAAHWLCACTHDPFTPAIESIAGYPPEIGKMVTSRCATTGCHDHQSHEAAGGLDLSTWDDAMRGGRNNAVIVPFTPRQSTFFFIINRFDDLGPQLTPLMPFGDTPLPREEVELVMDWITAGAPNAQGRVAFANTPLEQKLYILNSRCRQVAVVDLESGLVMRYVSLDDDKSLGFAERILLHPVLPYWYVLFTNGAIHRYDARNDALAGSVQLPPGTWRTLEAIDGGSSLYALNWAGNTDLEGGQIAVVDPELPGIDTVYSFTGDSLYFPIGWAESETPGTYYTVCYLGNFIYKLRLGADAHLTRIPLSAEAAAFNISAYRPTAVVYIPELSAYFVACEHSGEIRRFDALTGALQAVIPVGYFPQQMAIDPIRQRLFVSCTEDVNTFDEGKSSVYVIDLPSNAVVKTLYAGYQSRALFMDNNYRWLYVANRNADPSGADEPHHYTECEGKNGYLSRIDLDNLEMDDSYRAELSVDPYSMSAR